MKTPIELYEKETGDKRPTNQTEYNEWFVRYVEWLEKAFMKLYNHVFPTNKITTK